MSSTLQTQQTAQAGLSRRRLRVPQASGGSGSTVKQHVPVATSNAIQQAALAPAPAAPLPAAQVVAALPAPAVVPVAPVVATMPPKVQLPVQASEALSVPPQPQPLQLQQSFQSAQPIQPASVQAPATSTQHQQPMLPANTMHVALSVDPLHTHNIFPLLPSTNPLAVCNHIDTILGFCETDEHRLLYLVIRFRLELISTNDSCQSLFYPEASPFMQLLEEMAAKAIEEDTLSTKLLSNKLLPMGIEPKLDQYMETHTVQETFDLLVAKRDYYNAFLLATSCGNNRWLNKVLYSSKETSLAVLCFLNNIVMDLSSEQLAPDDIATWPDVLLWLVKLTIRLPMGEISTELLNMQKRYLLKLILHGYLLEAQISGIALGFVLEPGSYVTFISDHAHLLPGSVGDFIDTQAFYAQQNHMAQTMFINPQQTAQRKNIMASLPSKDIDIGFSVLPMNKATRTQLFIDDLRAKQVISAEMLLIAELVEYSHMFTYFYYSIKTYSNYAPPRAKSAFGSNIHQSLTLFPHLLPYKVHDSLPRGYADVAAKFVQGLVSVIPSHSINSAFMTSIYDNCQAIYSITKNVLPPAEIIPSRSLADAISLSISKRDKKGLQSLTTLVWSDSKIKCSKLTPTIHYSIVLSPFSPMGTHAWTEFLRLTTDMQTRKNPLPATALIGYRLLANVSDEVFFLGALTQQNASNIAATYSDSPQVNEHGFDGFGENSGYIGSELGSNDGRQQYGSSGVGKAILSTLGKKATVGLGRLFGTLEPETETRPQLEPSTYSPINIAENAHSKSMNVSTGVIPGPGIFNESFSQFLQQPLQPVQVSHQLPPVPNQTSVYSAQSQNADVPEHISFFNSLELVSQPQAPQQQIQPQSQPLSVQSSILQIASGSVGAGQPHDVPNIRLAVAGSVRRGAGRTRAAPTKPPSGRFFVPTME